MVGGRALENWVGRHKCMNESGKGRGKGGKVRIYMHVAMKISPSVFDNFSGHSFFCEV